MAEKISDLVIRVKYEDGQMKILTGDLSEADKRAHKLADAYTKVGIASGIALAAVVVGITKAVSENAKFSKGIAEITTLMTDATPQSIAKMKKELLDLSVASGQSLQPLLKARYDIVSAGFSDAAESAKVLAVSSKMAVGGVSGVNETADLLTTTLNAYKLSADDSNNVSDMLFTTVRLGKTTMSELASQMGQVLPVAKSTGLGLDNLGAAMATLTANGLDTAMSTTALRGLLFSLSAPTNEAKKAMDEYGITVKYFDDGTLDLLGTIKQFEGLDLNTIRQIIPEKEAATGILSLASSYDQLAENIEEFNGKAGATEEAYGIMADELSFKFDQLKNALNAAMIEGGQAFEPMIKSLVMALLPVVKGLGDWIAAHPQLTAAIGTSLGVIFALTGAFSAVALLLPKIITGLAALKIAMGPTGWLILGVGLAVGAIALYTSKATEAEWATTKWGNEIRKLNRLLEEKNIIELEDSILQYIRDINEAKEKISDLEKRITDSKKAAGSGIIGVSNISMYQAEIEQLKLDILDLDELLEKAYKRLHRLQNENNKPSTPGKDTQPPPDTSAKKEDERLLEMQLKLAKTESDRIPILQKIVDLRQAELSAAAPGTEAELAASEKLLDAEINLAEAKDNILAEEAEKKRLYREAEIAAIQDDQAREITAINDAYALKIAAVAENEEAIKNLKIAKQREIDEVKESSRQDEIQKQQETLRSLEASWNYAIQSFNDMEMDGRTRSEAIWRAFTTMALSQIGRITWAYIIGEKTKTAVKGTETAKQEVIESASFRVSMGHIFKTIGGKIFSFYAGSGPFGIPFALATIAGIFAAIRAIKFAEGGEVDRPTLGLLGEAGPELIVPRQNFFKVFDESILPIIQKQIEVKVTGGLQNAGVPVRGGDGASSLQGGVTIINNKYISQLPESGILTEQEHFDNMMDKYYSTFERRQRNTRG